MAIVANAAVSAGYPQALSASLLVIAVAPLIVLLASPVLGRLPGLRWVLATPQPLATLDHQGIELALPGLGTRRFGWPEIDHLELHKTWRRQ
jgi:hypothetical protein